MLASGKNIYFLLKEGIEEFNKVMDLVVQKKLDPSTYFLQIKKLDQLVKNVKSESIVRTDSVLVKQKITEVFPSEVIEEFSDQSVLSDIKEPKVLVQTEIIDPGIASSLKEKLLQLHLTENKNNIEKLLKFLDNPEKTLENILEAMHTSLSLLVQLSLQNIELEKDLKFLREEGVDASQPRKLSQEQKEARLEKKSKGGSSPPRQRIKSLDQNLKRNIQ